ncbi:MAG TPA: FecR domain-containing protein [Puia sp.]|jgi:ferric-dicitrate binding protein FerR (iron transport regulator)|nr:FecR domain-containing protein [Puia sp.]
MDNKRFTELLNLYLLDRITDQEGAELAVMLKAPGFQDELQRRIGEQLQNREFDLENPSAAVAARIQDYLDREIGGALAQEAESVPAQGIGLAGQGDDKRAPVHRVHFLRRPFWRYAAAVLAIIAGVYLYQRAKTPALLSQEKRFKNDLQPGSHRATLILPDGSEVAMTSPLAALTTKETAGTGEVSVNTRKGETYSLVLSDGTKVWLNTSSTLRCPAVFSDTQRRVELKGEAYFEVRHDAKKPFSVVLPDGSLVKDLGTRFNIHAYGDEKAIRTTVLEGSVLVKAKGHEVSLIPGEQAEYSEQEDLTRQAQVNLPNVVAWKEEQFVLSATSVQDIMKQVERWYGAEIVYQDNMQNDTTEFFGTLTRNVPVSQLLKTLEATGHVHFIIEGNRITVMK